jgi:hypothetical protein
MTLGQLAKILVGISLLHRAARERLENFLDAYGPTIHVSQFQHRMALLHFNTSPHKETFNLFTKPPGANKQT